MTLEYRGAPGAIAEVNDSDHTFSLRIVSYGVADSYGSVWQPGVFTRSLEQKLPSSAWAHDWSRIIGSLKEYDERADGLDGLVQFADFDAVPDAKMAWSLLKDGHIKDTSFGFKRGEWSDTRNDRTYKPSVAGEKERHRVARLDEVSPVLVGAVPGARTLAVRSEDRITRMDAGLLLTQVATGQLSLRDALNALEGEERAPATDKPHAFVPSADDPTKCAICGMAKDDPMHAMTQRGDEEDARLAWDMMRMDRHLDVRGAGSASGLRQYWASGAGASRVRWGTEGDLARCEALLAKYVPAQQARQIATEVQQLTKEN